MVMNDRRKKSDIKSQFLRFAGVGVIGTGAHYLVLVSLVQFAGMNPIFASMVGFVIGGLVNYFLNYHITFQSSQPHQTAMAKFFTVALLGLALNSFIVTLGIKKLAIHYLWAQLIATCLVLIWNFGSNRLWTFSADDCAAKYE
jgi:putative flippase GtrA